MALDKKSKLALFAEKFSVRYHRKMKVVRQMQTLQELQVISGLGATISRAAKESGKTPEEMDYDKVRAALSKFQEPSFGRGHEIYEGMTDHLKDMVWGYASNHFHYAPVKQEIDSLAISGGGGKGLFYPSALEHLEEEGVMDQIRTVAGTSAGALTAIPLALGCTSKDIKEMMDDTDFREFFIEGFSSRFEFGIGFFYKDEKHIQTNKWFKDIWVRQGKATYNEKEKIVNFLSSIKTVVSNDADLEIDSKKHHRFLGVALERPISKRFIAEAEHSIVVERLWKEPSIRQFCDFMLHSANEQAEYDYVKDPKKVLDIAVCFSRDNDFIEHYFAKLIKQRVDKFVQIVGKKRFSEILPNIRNFERESLTLADIGALAKTPEGRDFGFRDLAIGVTKTNMRDDTGRTRQYWNQIVRTQGIIASSDLSKTDSQELSNSPIKSLARLSMSIPFAFSAKRHLDHYYVDGGLHNNLPTEYFDRDGYSKKVVSIVPLTGDEIRSAETVPQSLRSSEPYQFKSKGDKTLDYLNVFKHIVPGLKKLANLGLNELMLNGNSAYKKMGFRESFRTMIINTGVHGTFTFRVDRKDYDKVSNINERSLKGKEFENSLNISSPTFFSDECNNLVKLYEHKIVNSREGDESIYQEALDYFNAKNEQKLATDPFSAIKSNSSIQTFLDRVSTKSQQLDF